jgi:pimeloyl-ACP methyl ester carboxylesterase
MVVSGVADRVPQRIRSLVFLDAFVPENGESSVRFAPISGDQLIDGWKSRPISAEVFGVNPGDRTWVDHQCTVQSVACFRQPVHLTGGIECIRHVSYVYASGWAGHQSPFHPFYEKARLRGWQTSEIACGHDVMLDQPDALAKLLIDCLSST